MAELLRSWLPKVIQRLQCFLSSQDISAGSLWLEELFRNLDCSKVGILCLTPESVEKPWILFEAGVIAKSFDKKRVFPMLLGLEPSQLPSPLAAFQGGALSKGNILKLLQMVNEGSESGLDEVTLRESFETRWGEFHKEASAIAALKEQKTAPKASTADTLHSAVQETLTLVRGIASGSTPVALRVGGAIFIL